MAAYIRLQDMIAADAGDTQRIEEVADVGNYSRITVQVRTAVGVTDRDLQLQHSAVLDDDAFADLGDVFELDSAGTESREFTGTLRYLRWSCSGGTGDATFTVDLVAREY